MVWKGKIVKIFKQTDNWICIRFLDTRSRSSYVAKGNVSGMFLVDSAVEIEGEFKTDPVYGEQIEIKVMRMTESIAATYLSKCVSGIGLKLAREIVRTLGENCIDKILKDDTLLLKVKGIKKAKYAQITKSLKGANNISLYFKIFELFNNDITENQASKIVKSIEEDKITIKKIEKNPYWLISHIDGFGFKKVDQLAMAAGMAPMCVERVEAAMVYSLQQISQKYGHVFADMDMLLKEVTEMLLATPENVSKKEFSIFYSIASTGSEKELHSYIKDSKYKKDLENWSNNFYTLVDKMVEVLSKNIDDNQIVVEDEKIYWKKLYEAEVGSAEIIARLANKACKKKITKKQIEYAISEVEFENGCELSDEQRCAVYNSFERNLSIITGGPGRGKTTIIKALIYAWADDENVVLLAPTGRAAKRMTEATGYKAQTIHRFIKSNTSAYGLGLKLYIIDETSMIGISLAYSLLKHVKDGVIVFVGDTQQLASVEPGCFMKDLIQSNYVLVSYLRKSYRNMGSIEANSDLINEGKNLKDFILDSNTEFIKAYDQDIVTEVLKFYKNALKEYNPSEIGILSPIRVRGSASVNNLNMMIRNEVNPISKNEWINGTDFRVNDRVMYIKNNYDKGLLDGHTTVTGIFNGDMGTITEISEEDETVTILLDDGKEGVFKFYEMENFILAYTMTIHKSQGSEYKTVLCVMSSQHAFMLKRNLAYTAFTRAKKHLTIVGDEKAIAIAARNEDDLKRNSSLTERIINNIKDFD